MRPVHPKKEIERSLRYLEQQGWRVEPGGSHAWGKVFCPYPGERCRCGEFCICCVWSTPRCAELHARQLCRVVEHCAIHQGTPGQNKVHQNRMSEKRRTTDG